MSREVVWASAGIKRQLPPCLTLEQLTLKPLADGTPCYKGTIVHEDGRVLEWACTFFEPVVGTEWVDVLIKRVLNHANNWFSIPLKELSDE